MPELEADVRIRALGNAATASRRSTVIDMASCRTESTELSETTQRPGSYGAVKNVTPAGTPARSLRLSVGEQIQLARIRSERAKGFLPSMPEIDFLLEVIERLTR